MGNERRSQNVLHHQVYDFPQQLTALYVHLKVYAQKLGIQLHPQHGLNFTIFFNLVLFCLYTTMHCVQGLPGISHKFGPQHSVKAITCPWTVNVMKTKWVLLAEGQNETSISHHVKVR